MLKTAIIFLAIALISGIMGYSGLEKTAKQIAIIIFFVFVALAVASFILHLIL